MRRKGKKHNDEEEDKAVANPLAATTEVSFDNPLQDDDDPVSAPLLSSLSQHHSWAAACCALPKKWRLVTGWSTNADFSASQLSPRASQDASQDGSQDASPSAAAAAAAPKEAWGKKATKKDPLTKLDAGALDAALANLDNVDSSRNLEDIDEALDPTAEGFDPTAADAPQPVSPSSARSLEGDASPGQMTKSTDADNVFLEREAVLGFGRKTGSFLIFQLLSMGMLLYAVTLASLFLYVFFVARSSITFVLVFQSSFLVIVLVGGMKAASGGNESKLNLYSFMLLMAIIMQFSLAMIVVARGDQMLLFFQASAAAAQKQLCADMGVDMSFNLTIDENSTALEQAEAAVAEVCTCEEGAATCIKKYLDKEYGLRPEQYQIASVLAVLLQILLAKLAWGMITDLDYEEDQKMKKQEGGPPTGTLCGVMLGGVDLMDTNSKRGRDPQCVLELTCPNTADKAHRIQSAKSQILVDTCEPVWERGFDQLVAYEGSKQLRISVFDMSKPKKPEPMGSSVLKLDGPNLDRGGAEAMDGEDEITVDLFFDEGHKKKKKKKGEEAKLSPAGSVNLTLIYVPVGGSAEKMAKSVTKSWYFEATVLMMVGVSMTVLALQSPTDPPSDEVRGVLALLEIFVATHMTIELMLELFSNLANGDLKEVLTNPWMILALYVCLCNWLAIFSPRELTNHPEGQAWSKLVSVSRIFRIVRPIRTLRMIRHIDIIVRILASSMGILLTVCVLLLFLLLLYSLIGMSCFSGAIQYTCMDVQLVRGLAISGIDEDMVSPSSLPYGCVGDCKLYIPKDLIERGVLREAEPLQANGDDISCPETLQCALEAREALGFGGVKLTEDEYPIIRCMRLGSGTCYEEGFNNSAWRSLDVNETNTLYVATANEMDACEAFASAPEVGKDEYGFQDFDNIIRAVITMFVQMTGDGGMHAMPQALYASGSASSGTAWMIFFTASVFLNLLALNLFLAVCCSAYSDINGEMNELEAKLAAQEKLRREAIQLNETEEEREVRVAQEAEDALSLEEKVEALDWAALDGRAGGCRNICKGVILSEGFEYVVSFVIVLNTVVMAFNHQGIDRDLRDKLVMIETVFLFIFLIEFTVKLAGLGRTLYFAHTSNKFDFFVVFMCLVGYFAVLFQDELVETFELEGGEDGGGMQALRAVRLLRALQLARLLHKQKALLVVLKTIFAAWKPICLHSFFCMFSVCMFAVMGMHFLGGSLGCRVSLDASPDGLCPEEALVPLFRCTPKENCRPALPDDYPYENFETFPKGVLACFELTVGEEWSHVMYWYMAHAGLDSAGMTTIIQLFFMAQYLWMNCILFSLFIAMLLENFNLTEEEKMPIQKKVWERRKRKALKHWRQSRGSLMVRTLDNEKSKGVSHTGLESMKDRLIHAAAVAELDASENKSLYLFTLNHKFRLRCATFQASLLFSNGILILIMISCVSLAVEGPAQGEMMKKFGPFFDSINVIILGAFVFEAVLKVIIHGFCFTSGPSKPYLKTKMNRVDFIIIVLCTIAYMPYVGELLDGGWAKCLRVVRVMTPLVNLTKNPEILLVVMSFVRAIPDTVVVMLPLFLMAVVFGVVGQEWFGGALGDCATVCGVETESRCTLPEVPGILTIVNLIGPSDEVLAAHTTLKMCIEEGGTWVSPMFNFDNALSGVSLLFVAITDGVHDWMVDTTASQDGGISILYWIAFHMVFTCFFLNLFIGVLSASFSKSKGTATQTSRQRQWGAVRASIQGFEPTATTAEGKRPIAFALCCNTPTPPWWFKIRLFCFKLATDGKLEMFWRSVIMLNTFTLATDKFPASELRNELVVYLNLACLSLCTCEVVIKLIGFGAGSFFSSGWLISDFVLVVVSWGLRLGQVRSGVEALRVVRVFRLIALASKMPTLVALVESLVNCLRASMALIAISCVIIYLYSVVGMNLFGSLPIDASRESFNDYNNFSNFLSGGALLVQIVFGQEIGGFVEDLAEMGVNFWIAFLFFASYYMVIVWVCMNLLLVSVLDTFAAETADTDTDGARVEDMEMFTHCWAALTVGVHSVPVTTKKKQGFLTSMAGKIADKVSHPMDTLTNVAKDPLHAGGGWEEEEEDDNQLTPEDGSPFFQGTVRITIQEVTGVNSDFCIPYVKAALLGADRTEAYSPPAMTIKGKAMFEEGNGMPMAVPVPDNITKEIGHTMSMNFTEKHEMLTFAVHDNFQFEDDFMGVVRIPRDDIYGMETPTTKHLMLQKRCDAPESQPRTDAGTTDHWARFETDKTESYMRSDIVVEEMDVEDEFGENLSPLSVGSPRGAGTLSPRRSLRSPRAGGLSPMKSMRSPSTRGPRAGSPRASRKGDPTGFDLELMGENDPTDTSDMTKEEAKAQKKEDKRWKKAEKKRIKDEKKVEKQRLKRLAKEEKRRKKEGLSTTEGADSPRSAGHKKDEWEDAGVMLKVTIKFERLSCYVPKNGYLGEYEVTYANKESNCGVEGWLECSVDGTAFERRYCYLQEQGSHKGAMAQVGHQGCIKMVTGSTDGNHLEHHAAAGKLKIQKIPIEHVMNIYNDFVYADVSHAKVVEKGKNESHLDCEFQIGVDEQDEPSSLKTEKRIGHISGKIVGAKDLFNVAKGSGELSDPYCVLTVLSTGLLAKDGGDAKQVHKTLSVEDNLSPIWDNEFSFESMMSTTTMLMEVYDRRILEDRLIGSAEFEIGSEGTPGGNFTCNQVVGPDKTVDLGQPERVKLKIKLDLEEKKKGSQRNLASEEPDEPENEDNGAGIVSIEIKYAAFETHKQVRDLQLKIQRTINAKYQDPPKNNKEERAQIGELKDSEIAVDGMKRIDYRFRALNISNQMAWVNAIRWLTRGCPEDTKPKPIPHADLVPQELVRASNNISLLDLPMYRLTRLINGLHKRDAVGGHLPTRRWRTYVIYNMETHAMAPPKKLLKRKETKRRANNGIYLSDIRGLNFHSTLERMTLLHLGKPKCLSYEEQAREFEAEVNSVSLHIIKTGLQYWVNKRRWNMTQGGKKFPKVPVWSMNEQLYLRASEAVTVARFRSLRVLFGEVKKRKPIGYDAEGGVEEAKKNNKKKEEEEKKKEEKEEQEKQDKKPGYFQRQRDKKAEEQKAVANKLKLERLKSEGMEMDIEKIEAVFKKLDFDGSGELDEIKMRLGMQMLMGEMPLMVEQEMMIMVDTDKSGTVDLPEFVEGFTTIAMACPSDDEEEDAEGDSDLDDLDKTAVDLQREMAMD